MNFNKVRGSRQQNIKNATRNYEQHFLHDVNFFHSSLSALN
jgi:hypothetical protein